MNFSEFKQWLGADPYTREPEVLEMRNSKPEFEAAAQEAEAFEHKLEASLHIQPPANLLTDILALTKATNTSVAANRPAKPWFMALAATVFMAVGAASVMLWQQQHYSGLEDYVQRHIGHDGGQVLARANNQPGTVGGVSIEQVNQVLEPFSATVDANLLAQIRFIKTCPTPNGDGAHFIVSTRSGPVTVIFMPETAAEGVIQFNVEGQRAHVVALKKGSIAIVGRNDEQLESVTPLLEAGIRPLRADT